MQTNPLILLHGKGSDLTNAKTVERRAKCKLITQTIILKLIDVAKEKGATTRVKAYWNTYHCQNRIVTSNGRIYGSLCKNRYCTYCCGIKKADMIKRYLPVLDKWDEPCFVTLTAKSVSAGKLKARIRNVKRAFAKIYTKLKKQNQRGKGIKLMGIKAVECNFNPRAKTYNPHIHLIVPNRQTAELLRKEWLALWTTDFAGSSSQYYREVKDKEKDLIEVIKYETKVFTEPARKKSRGKKGTSKIYIRALDNIHAAMKGVRLIDRFGFNAPKTEKVKAGSQLTDDYIKWQYDLKSRDWINEDHECTLAAYTPEHQLETILEENIDTTLE